MNVIRFNYKIKINKKTTKRFIGKKHMKYNKSLNKTFYVGQLYITVFYSLIIVLAFLFI